MTVALALPCRTLCTHRRPQAPPTAQHLPLVACHTDALVETLTAIPAHPPGPAAAALAASVSRALESMLGRPSAFRLRASQIRAALAAATAPLTLHDDMINASQPPLYGGASQYGCVAVACARLLRACVRHRAPQLRRWTRAVMHALRTLLQVLVQWSATHSVSPEDAAACAMQVKLVYQDLAASVRLTPRVG